MDNPRSFRRAFSLLAVCAVCAVTVGILGRSGKRRAMFNPLSAHAQMSDDEVIHPRYSNSRLKGTYTISMAAGDAAAIVSPITFLGSVVFDGEGNITSGTITEAATPYGGSTATCSVSVTGTYSLSSDATGTQV